MTTNISTIIDDNDTFILVSRQDIVWLKRMLKAGACATSQNERKNGTHTKIQKAKDRILEQLK